MNNMDLNIGVVGTGSIAISHLVSLNEIIKNNLIQNKYNVSIKIHGLCDKDSNKISNFKKKNLYEAKLYTTDFEELLKNKLINVIYICTPTKFHKDYFIRAAEEGKHVFIEKPLAFDTKEIKEMISSQKKHGIHAQVGLVLRHCPIFWKIKDLIDGNQDQLGENLGFIFRDDQDWPIATLTHPSKWRKDPRMAHAGCLYEHSIHDVDMLEYFFDYENLSSIKASIRYISPLSQKKLEDTAMVHFKYQKGLSGTLFSLWHQIPRDERRIEIFFENGSVILDGYQLIDYNSFIFYLKKKKKRIKMQDLISKYFQKINFQQVQFTLGAYFFQSLDFMKSLCKEENPHPDLQIGLRAHQIIEAAYKSSRENKEIVVDF